MPPIHTRGFKSRLDRAEHFSLHGARLGLASEDDYEAFADRFMQSPCPPSAVQFLRVRNGDIGRYDETEDVFAIVGQRWFHQDLLPARSGISWGANQS